MAYLDARAHEHLEVGKRDRLAPKLRTYGGHNQQVKELRPRLRAAANGRRSSRSRDDARRQRIRGRFGRRRLSLPCSRSGTIFYAYGSSTHA